MMSDPDPIRVAHEKLLEIRKKEGLKLKPIPTLREKILLTDGVTEVDFRLRDYQVIGVYHMLMMKRFVLGDDTGLGKTLEAIVTFATLLYKNPKLKCIVVTNKSVLRQWQREFKKFTTGIGTHVVTGGPKAREKQWKAFFDSEKHHVAIVSYSMLRKDFEQVFELMGEHPHPLMTVFDECTAFKNPTARIHQITREMAKLSDRVYGLTATLLRNHLIEGYGIYKVIEPTLFGTKTAFMREFCVTREINLPRSNRKITVIVGYKKRDIAEFKKVIDPFYLGRAKQDVAKELPKLVTTDVEVPLSTYEGQKYKEALHDKLLTIGDDEIETSHLTAITYCQEIVDSLHLLGDEDVVCSKEEALLEFLVEEFKLKKEKTDPDGLVLDKIIIHTRFKKMVNRLQKLLKDRLGIRSARITGDESDDQREKHQLAFQEGPVNVCFVTKAGSEAINLQQAKAIIFYDLPWSAGDYIQTLGRMIRIGSPHQSVLCFHFLATDNGKPTVDHRVRNVLEAKMSLIEHVLGARMAGTLGSGSVGDDEIIESTSDIKDIFNGLHEDAVLWMKKP